MAVKNLGRPQDLGSLQHRARIQGKALGIVRIIARGRSIECVTLEEWRIDDKVELHA